MIFFVSFLYVMNLFYRIYILSSDLPLVFDLSCILPIITDWNIFIINFLTNNMNCFSELYFLIHIFNPSSHIFVISWEPINQKCIWLCIFKYCLFQQTNCNKTLNIKLIITGTILPSLMHYKIISLCLPF